MTTALAHAENILRDVFKTVDSSGDGQIEYYGTWWKFPCFPCPNAGA